MRTIGWLAQQRSDVVCQTYNSVSTWKYPSYVPYQRGRRYCGIMTEGKQLISAFREPPLMLSASQYKCRDAIFATVLFSHGFPQLWRLSGRFSPKEHHC